jgi:release factor glutamine methyltransferase
MTIRDALLQGARRLEQSGVADPRLTAESLLAHCLRVDRTYLYTHDDRILDAGETEKLEKTLSRRSSGVPTQYITGVQEFFGRNFSVTGAVLIPRVETELIIESVLTLTPAESRPHILDIGTGSGAIAITLALELPAAHVMGTDISGDALAIARQNASVLNAQVLFGLMDLAEGITETASFDFVVSNPPYIDPADAPTLAREVREHEPSRALFADEKGLAVIRRIIPEGARLLKPGGYLLLEIGIGMDERVTALLDDRWADVRVLPDLQGIPRTVVARRT